MRVWLPLPLLAVALALGCQPVALAVMGDSTSLDDVDYQGYANHLEKEFGPRVEVSWPSENGETSADLLTQVEIWEPVRGAEVVLFNAGLHDITRPDGGRARVGLDDYVSNLTMILGTFDELHAQPVWRSTTPVPADYRKPAFRSNDDVITYNRAAAELMEDWSVPVVDLYGFTLPSLDSWQDPRDVHFNSTGNSEIAVFLGDWLRSEFGAGLADIRRAE